MKDLFPAHLAFRSAESGAQLATFLRHRASHQRAARYLGHHHPWPTWYWNAHRFVILFGVPCRAEGRETWRFPIETLIDCVVVTTLRLTPQGESQLRQLGGIA